jgi:hypothetical protein
VPLVREPTVDGFDVSGKVEHSFIRGAKQLRPVSPLEITLNVAAAVAFLGAGVVAAAVSGGRVFRDLRQRVAAPYPARIVFWVSLAIGGVLWAYLYVYNVMWDSIILGGNLPQDHSYLVPAGFLSVGLGILASSIIWAMASDSRQGVPFEPAPEIPNNETRD